MSKAKKLNLTMPELVEIAQAINKNTLDNRVRSQEEKINTDTFIRQFKINRKDFSETIKDTNITYNKSTFQYDSDDIEKLNYNRDTIVTPHKTIHNKINYNSDTLVIPNKYNESETKVIKSETLKTDLAIIEFEDMKNNLVEMLAWYKEQRGKENIIDIEIPIINIDRDKLTEAASTRGFKIYPSVIAEFKEFCKDNSQYTMQDLMAMSLIEYMKKYSNK